LSFASACQFETALIAGWNMIVKGGGFCELLLSGDPAPNWFDSKAQTGQRSAAQRKASKWQPRNCAGAKLQSASKLLP
jgi:hypothetical protein